MEYIIMNIVKVLLLSWFVSSLVDVRNKVWLYRFLLAICYFIIITFSNYINVYEILITTTMIILGAIISYFFTYNSFSELLLITSFEAVYSYFVSCLAIVVSLFCNIIDISIMTQIIYGIGILFISQYIQKNKIYLTTEIEYILILVLYFMHYVLQHFLQFYYNIKTQIPELIMMTIIFILCVVVFLVLIIKISMLNKEQIEYKRLKQEKVNEQALSYLYDQLKITKHDLKHDFVLLEYYLRENNYDEIKLFINDKKATIDIMPTLVQSQNKLINTIVNNKIIQAYMNNISVECYIAVDDIIDINDYDLNHLLSNILDNAIENCLDYGKIYIDIIQEELFLHIKVKNETDARHYSADLKTKKDSLNHGFGLKSIEKIIHRYHGTMEINHNQEYFEIQGTLILK